MDIVNESVPTFKDIEKIIFSYVCNVAVEMVKNLLEGYDRKLMLERDRRAYRHKGFKTNHIRCVFGDVAYRRAVYEHITEEGRKEFVYLLDDAMGMEVIGKMSYNSVEAVVKASTEMSFRKAASVVNLTSQINISSQGIWNTVQAFGKKLEAEETSMAKRLEEDKPQTGKEVPVLFEEADGIFLHLQKPYRPKGFSGKEIKVSTAYEGMRKGKDGRNEVVGKVMTAGFEEAKEFHRIREAMIQTKYNTDEIKYRFINGDGAAWVKHPYDPDTVYQLDRFHVFKKIIYSITDESMRKELKALYMAGKTEELLEKTDAYANSVASNEQGDKREEKARALYSYLLNNKAGIKAYFDMKEKLPKPPEGLIYGSMGTQESQNCSVITLRMKHHKGSWSIPGAGHMAKILISLENKTFYTALERYTSFIDKELVVFAKDILSAGAISKVVGKGKKDGNIHKGHWAMADAKMTNSRKSLLSAFGYREFSEIAYI
jgi:hypothetical protein